MKSILFYLLAAMAWWAVPADAQSRTDAHAKDAKFVSEVLALNSYEIGLLKTAGESASSEQLKEISREILPDHQKLDAELTAYANRFNLAMSAKQREKFTDKLNKWQDDASGADWDDDMIEELVDVHKDGVDMLDDAVKDVKDNELRQILTSARETMKKHLDRLLPMKGTVKQDRKTNTDKVVNRNTDEEPEDAKFFSDLRLMNAYELQLMEIILKKGNHRALKDAAQKMLEEHRVLDQRLATYAQETGLGNDADEAAKGNEKANKWRQKKGGMEWDADIIEELIDVHKDGIDMLQDAVTDVENPELKNIMNEAIPTMESHLEMLIPLKETVKKPWKEK